MSNTKTTTKTEETVQAEKANGDNYATIIVSRGAEICLLKADTSHKQYKREMFESVATAKDSNPVRVNCLSILVNVLNAIKANPMDGIMNIYTVGLVKAPIDEGYFKYWVNTGKTQTNDLSETEHDLWKQMSDLLFDKDVMMHVNLKEVPSQAQQKRNASRSSQSRDAGYDFLLQMSEKAWESVKKAEPTEANLSALPF